MMLYLYHNNTHMEHYYGNKYELMDVFLNFLKEIGVIAPACKKAGISRSTPYRWLDKEENDDFRQKFDEAINIAYEKNKEKILAMPKHKRSLYINLAINSAVEEEKLEQTEQEKAS